MKKKLVIVAFSMAILIYIVYKIDENESKQMDNLFKNDNIEVIDSLRIGISEICFIYQNSQIISGSDTKFIVFDSVVSCNLKRKKILMKSSELMGFYGISNDTIFVYSSTDFISQKLENGFNIVRVETETNGSKSLLNKKNLSPIVIKCD